jgi:hypothetical protein
MDRAEIPTADAVAATTGDLVDSAMATAIAAIATRRLQCAFCS